MSASDDQGEAWRRLAAAGHDLRQPMHALGLYLALLARKAEDPELGPRLTAALDEARDALDLALDYAKLQAGGWTPRLRECRLAEIFADLGRRLGAQARLRGVELRFAGGRHCGLADGDLLLRALAALAGGAVRASRGGRVLVGVRLDGAGLRIEVHAGGQADCRADELALALAAGLAALAGGRLEAASDRAAVTIPRARPTLF